MANARRSGLGLVIFVSMALGGCSAENAQATNDESSSSHDEVVGVTDLGKLESAVGLAPLAQGESANVGALEAGACYRALVQSRGYPTYQYRRYKNGAAFFAEKGSGYSSGDLRPVACVDLFQGESDLRSMSGVVLDAVLRYDLGKFKGTDIAGTDGARGRFFWNFERGHLFQENLTDDERFAAVKKRAHELELDEAPSISGRLLGISIDDVKVSYHFSPNVETKSVSISGPAVFLAYRYATRKADDTGVFTIDSDSVGIFNRTAKLLGDGQVQATTLSFTHGNLSAATDTDSASRNEKLVFTALAATAGRAPLAECVREGQTDQALPPFKCTGL